MKAALIAIILSHFTSEDPKQSIFTHLSHHILGEQVYNNLFYLTANRPTKSPAQYGFRYDDIMFTAKDGINLHGWFIHSAKTKVKGTVVFSHGNTGSIGTHFGFCSWLANAGYQVFLYDYRGFGLSEGKLDRAGMISDVSAAFEYVQSRPDIIPNKIISFAHSLGGAKSIVALANHKPKGLRAIIANATFASYQALAEQHAGFLGRTLISDELSPIQYIAGLEGTPILIIHGTNDTTVPIHHAKDLHQAAKAPKTFWSIKDGDHNGSLYKNNQEYRGKILAWLDAELAAP